MADKQKREKARLRLGVRDFAVPLMRTGSLQRSGTLGFSIDVGREIHQAVQEDLKEEHPGYSAELHLADTLALAELELTVSGRVDGCFRQEITTLEEIKTSYQIDRLRNELENDPEHPYLLQIRCYGYLYRRTYDDTPALRLRLICARSGRQELISVSYDEARFAAWVTERCQQLASLYEQRQQDKKRRRHFARQVSFPFTQPRPQQDQLMQYLDEHLPNAKRLLLQAPTGLGKTAGVLFPSMRFAFKKGAPLIYTAPKNSQFKLALDFFSLLGESVREIRILVLTSRQKACLQDAVDCRAEVCPYADGFYDRLNLLESSELTGQFWDRSYFQSLGKEKELCPYELSQETLLDADIIICDYNYLFSLRGQLMAKFKESLVALPKPLLVIDECHNLYQRVMDNLSPEMNLSSMASEIEVSQENEVLNKAESKLMRQCLAWLQKQYDARSASGEVQLEEAGFHALSERFAALLLERLQGGEHLDLEHPLVRTYLIWVEFAEMILLQEGRRELVCLAKTASEGSSLKFLCLDPSFYLKDLWSDFLRVVGFSATLKPFAFYQKLSGLSDSQTVTAEFASPFPSTNRKIIAIPQIETNFRRRELHFQRIADVIRRVMPLAPGHYLAFFPSYRFAQAIQNELEQDALDWQIVAQKSEMRAQDVDQLLATMKTIDQPKLVLAVQGGLLAEGVDYKGCHVKGVFIIGPAVPSFTEERRFMERYYQQEYGDGRNFAYVYPAMSRSIQAAGRAVRDQSERAVILLMDPRFLHKNHLDTLPKDWLESTSNGFRSQQILQDISSFWLRSSAELTK